MKSSTTICIQPHNRRRERNGSSRPRSKNQRQHHSHPVIIQSNHWKQQPIHRRPSPRHGAHSHLWCPRQPSIPIRPIYPIRPGDMYLPVQKCVSTRTMNPAMMTTTTATMRRRRRRTLEKECAMMRVYFVPLLIYLYTILRKKERKYTSTATTARKEENETGNVEHEEEAWA